MRLWISAHRASQALILLAALAVVSLPARAGDGVWTSGGPDGNVFALAADPTNPSTLYVATNGGFYKSTDAGATWVRPGDVMTNLSVVRLAIDPTHPSTIYAGGFEKVFKSTDSGGAWGVSIPAGVPGNYYWFTALAVNPSTPATVYAGWYDLGTDGGGLFRSSDSAATWAPAGLTGEGVFALVINPVTPSTLFAGTVGGVFRSTDGGGTWADANSGLADLDVSTLAIDPSTPTTLYAGTGGGVFKSTDAGDSWTSVSAGLTSVNVFALAINPANPATLYAGTDAGVFRSSESGASWSAFNAGLPDLHVSALALAPGPTGKTTLYAGTSNGVWQITLPSSGSTVLLPAAARSRSSHGAFYTTNVSLSNTGAAPLSFTMKFLGHDQDGSAGPERTFHLEAGKSVTYFDVLGSVFAETSNYGSIRITSDSTKMAVVSVTSTPGSGGALSQTVPAVRTTDLIPSGSTRSILYVRENDGFRTNLVLASNADVATVIDVALVSPEGVTLAAKSYSVPPNGMTQISRVVGDMGLSGPVTGARLVLSSSTPGAAFTAFASVIDNASNDPTTIEAR